MTIKSRLNSSSALISILLLVALASVLFSFGALVNGFGQILEKSDSSSQLSGEAHDKLTSSDDGMAKIAEKISATAKDMQTANLSAQILERKINRLSDALTKLNSKVEEIYSNTLEGENRYALEEIADELLDLQEKMKREALISLSAAVQQIGESTESLSLQVTGLSDVSKQLHRVKEISAALTASNLFIYGVSKDFEKKIKVNRAFIGALILGVALFVAFLFRFVTHTIVRSIEEVEDISEAVASGSLQMTDLSQSLSGGAFRQSESLEEISGSLRQIEAQTRQNASNSDEARRLAQIARDAAKRGEVQVEHMVSAMSEISDAGENISKVIKSIDSIAFQTNLLALNAAVEAARSGEAGMGFAVVAGEVRNLAAKSAQSARETEDLIKGAVSKTQRGAEVAAATTRVLLEIAEAINSAADLVSEIASASSEQARSISGVNEGLGRVETVTRETTSSARIVTDAAEELAQRAGQLRLMLNRFMAKNGDVESAGGPVK